MEIKITADKKLLEALDKIAEALSRMVAAPATNALQGAANAATAVTTAEPEEEVHAQPVEPAQTHSPAPQKAEPVPTREEIRSMAAIKIQAGHRDAVKALIAKCGGTRVSDVPEDRLAEFKAGLEAMV